MAKLHWSGDDKGQILFCLESRKNLGETHLTDGRWKAFRNGVKLGSSKSLEKAKRLVEAASQ